MAGNATSTAEHCHLEHKSISSNNKGRKRAAVQPTHEALLGVHTFVYRRDLTAFARIDIQKKGRSFSCSCSSSVGNEAADPQLKKEET